MDLRNRLIQLAIESEIANTNNTNKWINDMNRADETYKKSPIFDGNKFSDNPNMIIGNNLDSLTAPVPEKAQPVKIDSEQSIESLLDKASLLQLERGKNNYEELLRNMQLEAGMSQRISKFPHEYTGKASELYDDKLRLEQYGIDKSYYDTDKTVLLHYLHREPGEEGGPLGMHWGDLIWVHPYLGKSDPALFNSVLRHELGHQRTAPDPGNRKKVKGSRLELQDKIFDEIRNEGKFISGSPHADPDDSANYYSNPDEILTRARELNRFFLKNDISPTEDLIDNMPEDMFDKMNANQREMIRLMNVSPTVKKDYLNRLYYYASNNRKNKNTFTV